MIEVPFHRVDGPEDAPVLVLGPSLGTTLDAWEAILPALTPHWRVIRYDLPGHGGSPAITPPAAVSPPAVDVLAAADTPPATDTPPAAHSSPTEDTRRAADATQPGEAAPTAGAPVTAGAARAAGVVPAADGAHTADGAAAADAPVPVAAVLAAGVVPAADGLPAAGAPVTGDAARAAGAAGAGGAGAGGAGAGGGVVTVDGLADGVLVLLGELGVGRFAYAGVSLGGAIGTAIASREAERGRVASLTLICTSARFGEPEPWLARAALVRAEGLGPVAAGQASRWFTAGFVARESEVVERALAALRGVDPASYAACVEAVGGIDLRDRLEAIAAPTLVIGGLDDPATPPDHSRILAGGIPSARLSLLPDASHLAFVERPDAVGALLAAHLRATWPGRAPTTAAERHAAGTAVRRQVLGDGHVDRAIANTDAFTADFQDLITRYAWGEIWTRPGLDRRTRSCITLTALVAGGHLEELAMHVRAALRNGLTPDDIGEVLLQTAIYCGVPAANAAFAVAKHVLQEQGLREQDTP